MYGMRLNYSKTEILHDARRAAPKLTFLDGSPVPTTTQAKYLGSLISWHKPFEAAFMHRAGIAETSYTKLRLVWNSNLPYREKLKIFQSVFISTLIYGLDALTLQDKHLKRVDAFCYRFLRRIVGIKASFYSRISNAEVYRTAGNPRKPSDTLNKTQLKMVKQVFTASTLDPLHHVVFSPALKDRIQATGRRRGGKIPYWVETTTQRHFRDEWNRCSRYGILGPNLVYAEISRSLQSLPDAAPMRANQHARP